MTEPCSVLIAAADLLPALTPRATIAGGVVLTFTDAEALRALDAINTQRPPVVVLERQFAATPRGAALINRIKADPALAAIEIRVIAHDSDHSRVVPRPAKTAATAEAVVPRPAKKGAAAKAKAAAAASSASAPSTKAAGRGKRSTTAAGVDQQPLDRGTRRAPRFKIARKVDVLIDGNPAALVDLSTCGAQVVSQTVLKPNQKVRVSLNDEGAAIRVTAAIAWAAFEMPAGADPQYRAGMAFIDAQAPAIDSFCSRLRAEA